MYAYVADPCVRNVTDIDYCGSTPCLNGATCTDIVAGYSCVCSTGFTGYNCGSREYS